MTRAPFPAAASAWAGVRRSSLARAFVKQLVKGADHGWMISVGFVEAPPGEGLHDPARRTVCFAPLVDEFEAGREEGGEGGRLQLTTGRPGRLLLSGARG